MQSRTCLGRGKTLLTATTTCLFPCILKLSHLSIKGCNVGVKDCPCAEAPEEIWMENLLEEVSSVVRLGAAFPHLVQQWVLDRAATVMCLYHCAFLYGAYQHWWTFDQGMADCQHISSHATCQAATAVGLLYASGCLCFFAEHAPCQLFVMKNRLDGMCRCACLCALPNAITLISHTHSKHGCVID